jgi:hypothetical protein
VKWVLEEIMCEAVDWTNLPEDSDRWQQWNFGRHLALPDCNVHFGLLLRICRNINTVYSVIIKNSSFQPGPCVQFEIAVSKAFFDLHLEPPFRPVSGPGFVPRSRASDPTCPPAHWGSVWMSHKTYQGHI